MINKKNLWFLTLFSLILVLSVYYITMPSEILMGTNSNYVSKTVNKNTEKDNDDNVNVSVEESEILVALRVEANDQMKICSFLWVYYGYPTSCYEGRNVEEMRYECGRLMAQRDDIKDIDLVAGVPDSGIAHAIGYSNESHIQYGRPFIKYTPTWPRSFMPQIQADRNLIAKMKLIPIASLIKDKSLLLIDDSIVRGTQLRDTTEYLYNSGAKAVHIRPACPPIMYGCPYLNFSRSTSEMDLITRRVIKKREGDNDVNMLETYSDPDTPEYKAMVEEIRKELNFTSLRFNRLDDMIQAIGLDSDKICTYCFNGKK